MSKRDSSVEGKRIDFLQDSFKSYQRLLQNLVPMVLSEVDDDRNQHWESFVLISLKDIQEVVVLKEAHCSVGNLEMDSTDAFDDYFIPKRFS